MTKVITGISGGVDSAVTSYLLKEQGYDVTCAFLSTWRKGPGIEKRSIEEHDARRIADMLRLEFVSEDCSEVFRNTVVDSFINEYLNGRTPNPCIFCNREFKFKELLRIADELGAEKIATGHYAG